MKIDGVAWKIGGRMEVGDEAGRDSADRSVFLSEFKNLGRLDDVSRSVSSVLALLLGDAGLYPSDSDLDIPLLVSSESGFSRSDVDYFRDFVDYGETAGRANLFVYTLPTSPLADASVHFRLTGGITYLETSKLSPWDSLMDAVSDKFALAETKGAEPKRHIVVVAEESEDGADALAALVSSVPDSPDSFSSDPPPSAPSTIHELRNFLLTR
ncbi:MAG: hypothetical protein GXP32_09455 [Kiritimatiellaeota bacterium]|nr:hypothetical protein [Kiritimatiellota bacterium]